MLNNMCKTIIPILTGCLTALAFAPSPPDPAPFDAVLAARARDGGFDYRGATGQDRKRLAAYLANLGDARPAEMSADERKAFYVNAYNAAAIGIVLDRYPVKSIRDIDGAFREIRRRIGGEELSLDDVENRLRELKDARIHFAIVCASESCPALRPTAYRAETISADLDRQARAFVNDPRKNEIDRARGRLTLSKIFDWNHAEFERDAGSVQRFVARYVADGETATWLASDRMRPRYLEYDWSLNQR
jgi:Protein of unknown function, DUF547